MKRLLLAVGLSIVLHAALLASLAPPPPVPAPEPIEIEIVEAAPPPPPAPEPAPAEPDPAPRIRPRAPRPAPAADASRPQDPPRREAAHDGVRRNEIEPDLRLAIPLPTAPAPAPAGEEKAPARSTERRIEALIDEDLAHRRATEMRHPYWSGVRGRLEHGFEPDADAVKAGAPGKTRVARAFDRYLERAGRFGRGDNPYVGSKWAPRGSVTADELAENAGDNRERIRGGGTHDLLRHTVRVIVELVQDGSGRAVDARVVESSGSAGYDRIALARVREVDLEHLGPPENGRRTHWAFETTLRIQPPVPAVHCELDANMMPTECHWPMRETMKSSVRLVAIHEG